MLMADFPKNRSVSSRTSPVHQRLVSDESHELRTPLTKIRMAGDLIHESPNGRDLTRASYDSGDEIGRAHV